MSSEVVTEVMVLPDGMDPEDPDRHFAVYVRWRGPFSEKGRGGYAVVAAADTHLSHRGDWRYNPEPFLQRHYRWQHLESALVSARAVVEDIRVMGKTWSEWSSEAPG